MNLWVWTSTAVLATLLLAVFYFYTSGSGVRPLLPAQPTLLLVGPSHAGKTCLFQKIVHESSETSTYTSQKANIGAMTVENGKRIKVVDAPGHPKLFDSFKAFTPTAITFVLDSSTLNKTVDNVARNLLEVLTFARKNKVVEVAVLANKSDFFTALPANKIIELIEAEVDQLRQRQDGVQLESIVDSPGDDEDWLQDLSGPFKLKDECAVFSGSVLKNDVQSWQEWVNASFR